MEKVPLRAGKLQSEKIRIHHEKARNVLLSASHLCLEPDYLLLVIITL